MKSDLLLKLAAKLEWVHATRPKEFDYSRILHECGTPACAIGWATTIPETGLSIGGPRFVEGHGMNGYSAARVAFGLGAEQALFLFEPKWVRGDMESPDWTASAAEVANHIRRFVAEEGFGTWGPALAKAVGRVSS